MSNVLLFARTILNRSFIILSVFLLLTGQSLSQQSPGTTVELGIIDSLEDSNLLKAKILELEGRLISLETRAARLKVLRPAADVEFLQELVFGKSGISSTIKSSDLPECGALTAGGVSYISITSEYDGFLNTLGNGISKSIVYKLFDNENAPINNALQVSLRCRIALIEKELGIAKKPATDTYNPNQLKSRISGIYNEVNYDAWQNENIRFGVMIGRVRTYDVTTASISLNIFPSYRRNTPGRVDLARRISFHVGVGSALNSAEIDVETMVISAGISLEIMRGVSLNYGIASFDGEIDEEKESILKPQFSISLRSEMWSALVN